MVMMMMVVVVSVVVVVVVIIADHNGQETKGKHKRIPNWKEFTASIEINTARKLHMEKNHDAYL